MKAMILAAGFGSRMGSLTASTPKPLLKVAGKTLIQHLIENLAANSIVDLVINYSYLGEQIVEALGDGHKFGVNIQYSQEKEVLGTGGGVANALSLLGNEPFLLVNADVWTDYPFSHLCSVSLFGLKSLAHLVLVENADHNPSGDFVLSSPGLVSWPDSGQQSTLTYSGIALFQPEFFKTATTVAFDLLPMLKEAMVKGQVSGEHYQGQWVDVGTPERLASVSLSLSK